MSGMINLEFKYSALIFAFSSQRVPEQSGMIIFRHIALVSGLTFHLRLVESYVLSIIFSNSNDIFVILNSNF